MFCTLVLTVIFSVISPLVVVFCVDSNQDMPTTWPCMSEKVLVCPVLIDEEGFDLSAPLSVTLFYDIHDPVSNSCPEIKHVNLSLSAKRNDEYFINEPSNPLYAVKGTTISYNMTPTTTVSFALEPGCIYFYLHTCNRVSCLLVSLMSTYVNKSNCYHTFTENVPVFADVTINQTGFYVMSMKNEAKTNIKVNMTLNIAKYDTKPFSAICSMCDKELLNIEPCYDICTNTTDAEHASLTLPLKKLCVCRVSIYW